MLESRKATPSGEGAQKSVRDNDSAVTTDLAQARAEKLTLVSHETVFDGYRLTRLW